MKALRVLLPLLLLAACGQPSQNESNPGDPSRRYFGLHFDFHASPQRCSELSIGETLKEAEIRQICRELHPDFIQVDTKGHPGWASYPSKMGNAMPRFTGNPLRLWRQVTREEGVALYAHYSGVADMRYASLHPDHTSTTRSGEKNVWATRTNGPYVDSLLIPQLCELALDYGLDGAWVDGECWATIPDYSPCTVAAFREETSLDARTNPDEFKDYCRELFRRYLRHYVDSVHQRCPGFKLCSNWAFSDEMPEAVCAAVDFLSGDFRDEDSIFWARYTARSISKQQQPWDLMAWSFRRFTYGGHIPKHPVQLMQEAASVISLGGGFSVYVTQMRDGSPRTERLLELKPLADFMHAREPWTFGGEPKKQVAVFLSTHDRYSSIQELFSRDRSESSVGLVNILCDSGRPVTLLSEHDLHQADEYDVILVPNLNVGLTRKTVDALTDYAKKGGSLVLVGEKTAEVFGQNETGQGNDGADNGLQKPVVCSLGSGTLALIREDIGSQYITGARHEHRTLMTGLLDTLYDADVKVTRTTGPLEVVDMVKDGRRLIQLINAGGQHHNTKVYSEDIIPPLTDIVVDIRTDRKPRAIRLQPEGRKLRFSYKDGIASVQIPRLEIHGTLEITD